MAYPKNTNMTEEDAIFLEIGMLVLEMQVVEKQIKYILTYVLQDGSPVTYARILELEGEYHKKELGRLFGEMKKRADYSCGLELVFERFLKNRNTLIHRFHEVVGHEMSTEDDVTKVQTFLTQLSQDTFHLLKFFTAWIIAWRKQVGRPDVRLAETVKEGCEPFLREIESMTDFVNDHIFLKNSPNQSNHETR